MNIPTMKMGKQHLIILMTMMACLLGLTNTGMAVDWTGTLTGGDYTLSQSGNGFKVNGGNTVYSNIGPLTVTGTNNNSQINIAIPKGMTVYFNGAITVTKGYLYVYISGNSPYQSVTIKRRSGYNGPCFIVDDATGVLDNTTSNPTCKLNLGGHTAAGTELTVDGGSEGLTISGSNDNYSASCTGIKATAPLVVVHGGTFTTFGAKLTNNWNTGSGGAVYVTTRQVSWANTNAKSHCVVNMTSSIISNCYASESGGALIASCDLKKIGNNYYTSTIRLGDNGSNRAKSKVTNCFTAGSGSSGGGTFRTMGDCYNTLTFDYCTVSGNYTYHAGGAVSWSALPAGPVVVSNTDILNNWASGDGGGLHVNNATLTNVTIRGNRSGNNGGGFSYTSWRGGQVVDIKPQDCNISLDANTVIENNTAAGNGGGFYMYVQLMKYGYGTSNEAPIYNNNNNQPFSVTLNINGATIRGNSATNGGGVWMNKTSDASVYPTIININSGDIYKNTATNYGGAFYVTGGVPLNVGSTSGTLNMMANSATNGGCIYLTGGNLTMKSGSIGLSTFNYTDHNNVAHNGEDGSNKATTGNGGGIYVSSGTFTMQGGTIAYNQASSGNGGGIYVNPGSSSYTTTINSTSANIAVSNNKAENGGGIFVDTGVLNVERDGTRTITIQGNQATSGDGGGIYAKSNVTVAGASIVSNKATSGNGGAVYASDGTITFNNAANTAPSFTSNEAVNGGVLYMDGTSCVCNINAGTLGGSHADRNKATTSGGAIYVNKGTVNFATGEITYNTAGVTGGGLYVASNGVLNMTGDVTLNYNHVPAGDGHHGGGVYLAGKVTVGASTARTINAQYNFVSETVDVNPSSVTINATNRNNVYLPNPTVNSNRTDVITVVKNGLTNTTRVGFSVPGNFVPVIYCNESSPYTFLESFLIPVSSDGMKETVFDDAEKYTTVHFTFAPFDANYIFLSGGTWVEQVSSSAPTGFSVSDNNVTISSEEALAWLIRYINGISTGTTTLTSHPGVNVILTKDLNMSAYPWVPLASTAYTGNAVVFTGTFDGQGHTIEGIDCRWLGGQTGTDLGLFGNVGTNGTVKNISLKNALINTVDMTSGNGSAALGSIVGRNTGGTVMNCTASATIETTNANAVIGGLVGQIISGTVHSSYASAELIGYKMGGLAGSNSGNLYNSFANPQFNYSGPDGSTNYYVGGLVADNGTYGTVQNCYVRFSRTQTLTNALFGQLAGNNEGSITDCYTPLNYTSDVPATIVHTGSATSDTYKVADAPYKYDRPNDNKVGSTVKTLTEKLNEWVSGQHDEHPEYAYWKRTTAGNYTTGSGNINDDYPIHKMVGLSNAASPDGLFIEYKYSLDATLTKYNDLEDGGTVWVYDSPLSAMTASGGTPSYESVSVDNANKVKLYIDEDASLLQAAGNTLTAYTGQTLRNYSSNANRWHNVSSSLKQSGIGFDYYNDGHGQHADFNWSINPCNIALSRDDDNAFFPSDMPWPETAEMDFYCFYEPEYHWLNLKRRTDSHYHMNANDVPIAYNGNGIGAGTNGNETYMVPGKGYLVSIDKDQLIQNKGELNNGTVTLYSVTKTDYNAWAGLLGYNLLGNPYQSYLDFEVFMSQNLSDDAEHPVTNAGNLWVGGEDDNYANTYATFDPEQNAYRQYFGGTSSGATVASRYIHPHQGFFIRMTKGNANTNTTTVTFTNAMRTNATDRQSGFRGAGQPSHALVNFVVRDAQGKGDIAVLELNRDGDEGAEKIRMGDGTGHLSLGYDGKAYAILFRTEVGDYQPLWFEATEAGTFTLGWDIHNAVFESLTLVDNIAGTSTDMLATDSYTFQGSPDHYASRFKVVIGDFVEVDPDAPSEPEPVEGPTFAFIVGDELVVDGEGTLQVFDVMGRQLSSTTLSGTRSTVGLPAVAAGVYVLRLTNENGTKVQKIVME